MVDDWDAGIIAVDPIGCGCTECIIGEYVPLEHATEAQAEALLKGELVNNTSMSSHALALYFDAKYGS